MKYFKNTAISKEPEPISLFGKNDGPLWQAIVKLFGSDKGLKQYHSTGLEDIANNAREYGRQKDAAEYEAKYFKTKPYLEDNSNDTNF